MTDKMYRQTHAAIPHSTFNTSCSHCPTDTRALDFSRGYPNELISIGAYDHIVDDGARPAIVRMTCG